MAEMWAQILMSDIAIAFQDGHVPKWYDVEEMFMKYNLSRSTYPSFLPSNFLREFFKDSPKILRRVGDMLYRHHQIVIVLMKDYYGMMSCNECGCIWKNPLIGNKKSRRVKSDLPPHRNNFVHGYDIQLRSNLESAKLGASNDEVDTKIKSINLIS